MPSWIRRTAVFLHNLCPDTLGSVLVVVMLPSSSSLSASCCARCIIHSSSKAPCSTLHNWKAGGHVGVRDHLPCGGAAGLRFMPPLLMLFVFVGQNLEWRCIWTVFENDQRWTFFFFETLSGPKFYAAGLIVMKGLWRVIDRTVMIKCFLPVSWSVTCASSLAFETLHILVQNWQERCLHFFFPPKKFSSKMTHYPIRINYLGFYKHWKTDAT